VRRRRGVLLAALLVSVNSVADDGLIIAVASNFQSTAREIAAEFTQATHIPVRISAGSTGKLYVQILNGAPYDIFLAADTERPRSLEKSGVAVAGPLSTYAIGALVLVSADPMLQDADCLKLLIDGNYRKIAIANPETAPYGAAARDYLQRAGLWEVAKSRMIMGENVLQTFLFVATANATLGIVAASVLIDAGEAVDIECREPLEVADTSVLYQGAFILSRASDEDAALLFMNFLHSERARDLISSHGYEVPNH